MMEAAHQPCQNGDLFWFNTQPEGSIFAVAHDGGWMAIADQSPPDQKGFDWARENVDGVGMVGAAVAGEVGYSGQLEATDNGWRFTAPDGEWIELDRGSHDEPEPPPAPEPEPTPPTPSPEPQALIVRVEQQPVFAVFEAQRDAINIGDVSRFTWLEDGRARVILKVTDIFVDEDGKHTISGCGTVYLPPEQAKELWALLLLIGYRLPLEP